jgi:hypothetical protein
MYSESQPSLLLYILLSSSFLECNTAYLHLILPTSQYVSQEKNKIEIMLKNEI